MPKPRKVGRPTLPKGNAKDVMLRVRVTADDLKAMGKLAKNSKQTISQWIRRTITMEINGSTSQPHAPAGSNNTPQEELVCSKCGKPIPMTSLTSPANPLCEDCK